MAKKLTQQQKEKMSAAHKGIGLKGGYKYVYYDSYSEKLKLYDEVRQSPTNNIILEVRCYYKGCNNWFIPNRSMVSNRISCINGHKENRNFYCSDKCRHNCSGWGKHINKLINGYVINNFREAQPELRLIVFERDNWTCQICENKQNLICHHYEVTAINPIESADVDNCITLCATFHKKYIDTKDVHLTTCIVNKVNA